MSKQNVQSTANPADQISEEQLHTVSAGALDPVPQDRPLTPEEFEALDRKQQEAIFDEIKEETLKNLPTFRDAPRSGWL